MTENGERNGERSDGWRLPTLQLWLLFLAVGLLPKEMYYLARNAGRVVTQDALVNSPSVITLAFAAYLGIFAYRRCREDGLPVAASQGRAIQLILIGLIAFLPVQLSELLNVGEIPVANLRRAVYVVWSGKLAAWFYLISVFIRIYGLENQRVFGEMFSVFPSARLPETNPASAPAPETADRHTGDGEATQEPPIRISTGKRPEIGGAEGVNLEKAVGTGKSVAGKGT